MSSGTETVVPAPSADDPAIPSARISLKIDSLKHATPPEDWQGDTWLTAQFFPIHSMASEESNILGRMDVGSPTNPFNSAIEGDGIESQRIAAPGGEIGWEIWWNCPLKEDCLTYLANTIVAITVHTEAPSAVDGTVAVFPLSNLLMNPDESISESFPCKYKFTEYPKDPARKLLDIAVPSEVSEPAGAEDAEPEVYPEIELRVGGDVCFREFCGCGRVMRFDPRLLSTPKDWEPTLKEDESGLDLTLDSWRNGHNAVVTLHRPTFTPPHSTAGDQTLWQVALAMGNGHMRWNSETKKWVIDWAPHHGVAVRLDNTPGDATAYTPYIDLFLDHLSVSRLQKSCYEVEQLWPVLVRLAGEKDGYEMGREETEAIVYLDICEALQLGYSSSSVQLNPKPLFAVKEELYGIVPAVHKKVPKANNHVYTLNKTSLEVGVSMNKSIEAPPGFELKRSPSAVARGGGGGAGFFDGGKKKKAAIPAEESAPKKCPSPEPPMPGLPSTKMMPGFDVSTYMSNEVLPQLVPALTALAEAWRNSTDKPRIINPLRWVATYLDCHNNKRPRTASVGTHGALAKRIVELETERGHASALLKAAAENNPPHVGFWMSIGGECAVLPKKEKRPNYAGWTALHYAVFHNNVELTTVLLHANADPNAASDFGVTPVMIAAHNGCLEIVQVLLNFTVALDSFSYNDAAPMAPDCGATGIPEVELKFGHSALHWALQECAYSCEDDKDRMDRKAELAKVLLEHGADADALSATGDSAWQLVALHKEMIPAAESLAVYGRRMHEESFPVGDLLSLSSQRENVALLSFLYSKGFDLNSLDAKQCTALFCAARCGFSEGCQFLGDKGADLTISCTDLQQLAIHAAAENNNFGCVQVLASLKADLEACEGVGQRPLHTAAKCGHLQVVEMLLGMKVQVDPLDNQGRTPYTLAAQTGHHDVARVLTEHGACVSVGDEGGEQAIHLASGTGMLDLVDFAILKGAPVDVLDNMGQTGILKAARNGHLHVVEYLALAGASVNTADCNLQTPLHHAAQANHTAVVDWLCKNGAQVDATDKWTRTPLYLAAALDNKEIVQMLLAAGVALDLATEEKLLDPQTVPTPAKAEEPAKAEVAAEPAAVEAAPAEGAEDADEEFVEEEPEEEKPEEVSGRAAIHIACEGLFDEVVHMLAAAGAEVDTDADDGWTPLQTAIMSNADWPDREERMIKILDSLVHYGANITGTDYEGRSAYQNATVLALRKVRARLNEVLTVNDRIETAATR